MFIKLYKALKLITPNILSLRNFNLPRVILSFFLDYIQAAANIAPPVILGELYRRYSEGDYEELADEPYIYLLTSAFVAAWTFSKLAPVLQVQLLNPVRTSIETDLSVKILEKCYDLELDEHLSTPTGEFAVLLSKNYYTMGKLVPELFGKVTPAGVETVIATGILSYFYGPVGTLNLVPFSGYSLLTWLKLIFMKRHQEKLSTISNESYGKLLAAIGRYELAHDFDNVKYELNQIADQLKPLERQFNRFNRWQALGTSFQMIFNGAILAGILALIFSLYERDDIDIIASAVITYYMTQFISALSDYSRSIDEIYTALSDFEKVIEFLSKESPVSDRVNAYEFELDTPPRIEFRNVSFSYGDDVIALNNISFTVEEGRKVAIVGSSGAGKSTLIKLLLRFYNCEDGVILINDENICDITASSLRRNIAVVTQKTLLSNDSIAENIAYGSEQMQIEIIEDAARLAGLASLMDTGEGLDRNIGEGGDRLSGGEKQRVSIARALLKGSYVLLLDEPTSSLDNETEAAVQEVLDRVAAKTTTLVVTHRLHTIINSDLIIYLHNGEIVEQGSFHELIDEEGYFYKQFAAQCIQLGMDINSITITEADKPRNKYKDEDALCLRTQFEQSASISSYQGAQRTTFFGSSSTRRKQKGKQKGKQKAEQPLLVNQEYDTFANSDEDIRYEPYERTKPRRFCCIS